ncbi:hypothetical protein K443DRAFT_10186 [Laccaria amethystina LaAM-08-1]|uniref:Uncharacterized protein n=1 Tax=Laccaria amethystina LaAM-08-1 TaxID=1095629 RepID=A0A0C9WL71_9AGAR|nr:hypothetical protein K443DRAFT_10186 [Laccaria amethystina LaAM-08-1]
MTMQHIDGPLRTCCVVFVSAATSQHDIPYSTNYNTHHPSPTAPAMHNRHLAPHDERRGLANPCPPIPNSCPPTPTCVQPSPTRV